MSQQEREREENSVMHELSSVQSMLVNITGIKEQKIYNEETRSYTQFPNAVIEYKIYTIKLMSAALSLLIIKKLKRIDKLDKDDSEYLLVFKCILKQLEPFYTRYISTFEIDLNIFPANRIDNNTSRLLYTSFVLLVQRKIEEFEKELQESMQSGEVYKENPFAEPEFDEETGDVWDGEKQYYSYYLSLYYSVISKNSWNKNNIENLEFYKADFGNWEPPKNLASEIKQVYEKIIHQNYYPD